LDNAGALELGQTDAEKEKTFGTSVVPSHDPYFNFSLSVGQSLIFSLLVCACYVAM
jgi:hypothetical protein